MIIKKGILFFYITSLFIISSSFYSPAQDDGQEYALKAAFIYRFTDYVQWATNNESQNFTIAVLGQSAITAQLNDIARDKKVKDKSIYVKECNDVNNIGNCQVLFISHNYTGNIEPIISKIADKPILIITEEKGACEKGAHINFLLTDNKLKFEINVNATNKAGLKISSQLLQHSILVNSTNP